MIFAGSLWGIFGAATAQADMAEEPLRLATEGAATHLFPLNPAVVKPQAARGGLLVARQQKEASLDHLSVGGDKVTAKTAEESILAGLIADLGAGAGIGVTHQLLFRKTETELASDGRNQPREELGKIQHSTVRLMVELTTEIRAGIAMRYLYKDLSVLGNPFLDASETTRYKTTMVGYGAGASYTGANFGVGYTYYPPLRGKTEIYGEERIVVESGFLSLDGYFRPRDKLTVGLLAQRWLNEIDDLATGTTAADDETEISLYGLDPDQYLFPSQLLMVGFDYAATPVVTAKLSVGQERATLNFADLRVFSRADVNGSRSEPVIKYNRLRAAVAFTLKGGLTADLGLGLYNRQHDFSEAMNGGSYEGEGRELYGALSAGF